MRAVHLNSASSSLYICFTQAGCTVKTECQVKCGVWNSERLPKNSSGQQTREWKMASISK